MDFQSEQIKNLENLNHKPINHGSTGLNDRLIDTIYQNTTGKPFLLIINCFLDAGDVAGGLGSTSALLKVESITPPTATVYLTSIAEDNMVAGQLIECDSTIIFIIPPNYYYEIVSSTSGSLALIDPTRWYEVELF